MIADASVLIVYARTGRLALLRDIAGSVEVPERADREAAGSRQLLPDAVLIQAAIDEGWVQVVHVSHAAVRRVRHRFPHLGPGEASCIAAAAQEDQPIALDDLDARRAARLEGLEVVGSLGLLKRGYRQGRVRSREDLAAAVRGLVGAGLWTSAVLIEDFWADLGGRPTG